MRHFFIISLFFVSAILQAQTLEEADSLYADKKYIAAAEIYEQLYRFDRAVESCRMQIASLEKGIKNKKKIPVAISDSINSLSEQATNLERLEKMVRRCEDIQIIDSIIVDKNDFLNAYHISEDAGTLAKTPNSVIYENQLKNRRFYATQNDENGFRLYTQMKIQGGWSEEKPLNIPVDSLGDDNYPFVMADGLTIYYASTGNESIGGYDLFISRYNIDNDTYLAPGQLGMPFNSTYNDYMLVIDELHNVGYFATDRFLPENQVVIYTFIPNEYPLFVEDDDFAVLSSRAAINSIRDTWRKETNYQALLQKITKDIEKTRQQTIKKDFTFVINDTIVYYTLADFQDTGAKQTFLRSQDLQKQISTLENQLEVQRRNYAEGDANRKQTLKLSILEKESQLENLYDMFGKTEIEARNREISKLRIKN